MTPSTRKPSVIPGAVMAALGLLAAGIAPAATRVVVETAAEEVTGASSFGVVNGLCSLGEALNLSRGGTSSPDCPTTLEGEPGPLVIELQGGAVYARTESLPSLGGGPFLQLEIRGNGATIERAPSAGEVRLLEAIEFSTGAKLTIRDLTLRAGRVTGTGAGLRVLGFDLALSNVTFVDNRALDPPDSTFGLGGGLYASGGQLTIEACRFSGNSVDGVGGAAYVADAAGTILDCQFQGNTATGSGGALSVTSADLAIVGSQFEGNQSDAAGGALVFALSNTRVVVDRSTFRANDTFLVGPGGTGGAISAAGEDVLIRNSLFDGNAAARGGAISRDLPLSSSVRVENSTFFGNAADYGAALLVEHGLIELLGATIVGNSAANAGGGIFLANTASASVTIDHAIVLGNGAPVSPVDCVGPRRNGGGFSLIGDCGLPLESTDRQVDLGTMPLSDIVDPALADNGGPTQTLAVTANGLAHNAGNREYGARTGTDQRGFPRVAEGRVDIGAHERAASAVDGMVGVLFRTSMEGDEPRRYFERERFLEDTGAVDATGPLPALGNQGGNPDPIAVGTIAFVAFPGSGFNFANWTSALPGLPDATDTIDLALNGLEQFDVRTTAPVTAFGFDFLDPNGDGTLFTAIACASEFDPGTETCAPADIVFSLDFLSRDTGRRFVGFRVPEAFRQVSIREQTNVNDNEFFGHFYTAQ